MDPKPFVRNLILLLCLGGGPWSQSALPPGARGPNAAFVQQDQVGRESWVLFQPSHPVYDLIASRQNTNFPRDPQVLLAAMEKGPKAIQALFKSETPPLPRPPFELHRSLDQGATWVRMAILEPSLISNWDHWWALPGGRFLVQGKGRFSLQGSRSQHALFRLERGCLNLERLLTEFPDLPNLRILRAPRQVVVFLPQGSAVLRWPIDSEGPGEIIHLWETGIPTGRTLRHAAVSPDGRILLTTREGWAVSPPDPWKKNLPLEELKFRLALRSVKGRPGADHLEAAFQQRFRLRGQLRKAAPQAPETAWWWWDPDQNRVEATSPLASDAQAEGFHLLSDGRLEWTQPPSSRSFGQGPLVRILNLLDPRRLLK